MKKLLSVILAISLLAGLVPSVAGAEADPAQLWETREFTYGAETGVELTAYNGTASDVFVPAAVTVNGEEKAVLKLGDGIFSGNTDINSATLGAGIKVIGANAFAGAANLVCVVANEDLEVIGAGAFSGCAAMNSMILYPSVSDIGEGAFTGCDKLTLWCDENTAAHRYAEANSIPYEVLNPAAEPRIVTVEGVSYHIFNGEAILWKAGADVPAELTVPAQVEGFPVTKVGTVAFKENKTVTSVTLPETVTVIENEAFIYSSLAEIQLPESLQKIGESAFQNTRLRTVSVPDGVAEMGERVFSHCERLEEAVLPQGLRELPSYLFELCTALRTIDIPKSVTTISNGAFYMCNSLTEMTVPGNVEVVDVEAFFSCASLSRVVFEEGVRVLGARSFSECRKLEYVILPESMTQANARAFTNVAVALGVRRGSYTHTLAKEHGLPYYFPEGNSAPTPVVQDGVAYLVADGEATVLRYQGDGGTAVIASQVEGAPVTCIGPCAFCQTAITGVEIPNTVTQIGNYAFLECWHLTEVTIPDSVETLGEHSFSGCGFLTRVQLPKNLRAIPESVFAGCSQLSEIDIPGNVTTIGPSAFMFCESLERIVIPEGVTLIENSAFSYCAALADVVLPSTLRRMDGNIFDHCKKLITLKIPGGLEEYWECFGSLTAVLLVEEGSLAQQVAQAFNYPHFVLREGARYSVAVVDDLAYFISDGEATVLSDQKPGRESITIPAEVTDPETGETVPVTRIGNGAFAQGTMSSVSLPKGLREVGDDAFYWCSRIRELNLPSGVKWIGNCAFQGCGGVENLTIPEGVEVMIGYAFCQMDGLKSVSVPATVKQFSDGMFSYCSALKDVTLADGLTSIGNNTFSECASLETVTIPDSVTEVSARTFVNCTKLKQVQLPASWDRIDGVFEGCTSLREYTVSDNVTSIDGAAFAGCSRLAKVVLPAGVTHISAEAFQNTPAILWVMADSYAHQYAKANDLPYFVYGRPGNPEVSYGQAITGTVRYADGTPAAGATVELLYADGLLKETVTADETGAYAFTYAEVGEYLIRTFDTQGRTQIAPVKIKRMNAFDVFLAGDPDITLQSSWQVSGNVRPAGSAHVTLADPSGNLVAEAQSTDGSFRLENIPNGSYILKAEGAAGSAVTEVTVFNGDVTGVELTVPVDDTASISGTVLTEDESPRAWAQVTLYDAQGNAVATAKSGEQGAFAFEKLPLGEYSIVAEATEMRPGKWGFEQMCTLRGYAHVDAAEAKAYPLDPIVLTAEGAGQATVSGKVTAKGQVQRCQVTLRNIFGLELARYETGANGKYCFTNLSDGIYSVAAVTEDEGMGLTVVTVLGGRVYGLTDIRVVKEDDIRRHEETLRALYGCTDAQSAAAHRETIAAEKAFYDGLSEKRKKQCSEEYVAQLDRLSKLVSGFTLDCPESVTVAQEGTLISKEDIEQDKDVSLTLTVDAVDPWTIGSDGVQTGEEFMQQMMEDTADDRTLAAYYDISVTKNDVAISEISKDTDTTGQVRITMPIPQEYAGHENYTVVHMHNGEVVTLVDQDDDPDTVTFETGKFSRFALAYDDVVRSSPVTYDQTEKQATVVLSEACPDAVVVFAAYRGGALRAVDYVSQSLTAGENVVTAGNFAPQGTETIKIIVLRSAGSLEPVLPTYALPVE